MRSRVIGAWLIAALAASGTTVSVFAQIPAPASSSPQTAGSQPAATAAPQVRRLTADEAVQLALENNLGIQVARMDPQIQDLSVAAARAGWSPSFTTTLQSQGSDSPNQNSITGGSGNKLTNDQVVSNLGMQQTLPWGATYDVGWNSSRVVTNSTFTTFSPQLRSSLSLNYSQPLLRGFAIDTIRQQLQVNLKNREIADVTTRQTIATTTRQVRNAYWNLAYAVASLAVQQQSLELAQQSLRDTRARVEIGTTPPIDIVEAEAEVAQREEAVIVAQAQIATSEDTLRALVFDPDMPDFWSIRIEPTELPPFQPNVVDLDAAVRNALDRRTDLQQTRKSVEATDVNIRFFRNQTLPDVTANLNYGLQGLGGTQLVRGPSVVPGVPGPVIGEAQRSFSTVLSDLFANEFPSWTASLNISYPIGTSQADANLARSRMQRSQGQTRLKNQELQAVTQVRQYARSVSTNQQRVQSTLASRQLAERRLEAEQKKFQAGTSTSFLVFQAQRDLAQARNNELRAILDYNQSVVDFETVQEVPLGTGAGGAGTGTGTNTGTGTGTTGGVGTDGTTTGGGGTGGVIP